MSVSRNLEVFRYLPGEYNFLHANQAASAVQNSALAFIPAKFSGFRVSASSVARLERKKHVAGTEQGEEGVPLFCNMAAQMSRSFSQKRESRSDQPRLRTPEVQAVTCRCPELDRRVRNAASAQERPERSRFPLNKRNRIMLNHLPSSCFGVCGI